MNEVRTIDAEALKRAIDDYVEKRQDTLLWQADIEEIIDNAPTIDIPIRYKGEWQFDYEHTEFGNPYGTYRCSCCGGHSSGKYPYCFWCGAEMRKGDES